jgi:hypothetical protein
MNAAMHDFHVEVRDQEIVVTMPGTSLRVVYRKPHRGLELVARLLPGSAEGANHTRRIPD